MYYRAEVLFRAGIDPHRAGTTISDDEFDAIWADLLLLMPIGVRRGQMHVMRPDDDHSAPSYRPDRPRTYVYRRAGSHAGSVVCRSPTRSWRAQPVLVPDLPDVSRHLQRKR